MICNIDNSLTPEKIENRTKKIGKVRMAAARLFELDDDILRQHLPIDMPWMIIVGGCMVSAVLIWGWYRVYNTKYLSCDGEELHFDRYQCGACGGKKVGDIYTFRDPINPTILRNATVAYKTYLGGPLNMNPSIEIAATTTMAMQCLLAYIISLLIQSFALAWTVNKDYSSLITEFREELKNDFEGKAEQSVIDSFEKTEKLVQGISHEWLSTPLGCRKAKGRCACICDPQWSWRAFCMLGAVIAALLLPAYYVGMDCYRGTLGDPLVEVSFGLLIFVIQVASIYMAGLVSRKPYALYYENYLLMKIMYHTSLDFQDPNQLAFWRKSRFFFVGYTMPMKYGEAQWSFAGFVVTFVCTLAFLVYKTIVAGVWVWLRFSQLVATVLCVTSLAFAWTIMSEAVRIWYTQLSHIELLEDHKFDVRLRAEESTDEDETFDLKRRLDIVDDIIGYIREHDDPPRVFGLAIKPTLFRVLQGYVATAFVTIVLRIVLNDVDPDSLLGEAVL